MTLKKRHQHFQLASRTCLLLPRKEIDYAPECNWSYKKSLQSSIKHVIVFMMYIFKRDWMWEREENNFMKTWL